MTRTSGTKNLSAPLLVLLFFAALAGCVRKPELPAVDSGPGAVERETPSTGEPEERPAETSPAEEAAAEASPEETAAAPPVEPPEAIPPDELAGEPSEGLEEKSPTLSVKPELAALPEEPPPESPPALSLQAPSPGAVYQSSIYLEGQAANSEGRRGQADRLTHLYWEIENTDRKGELPFGEDGGFQLTISTTGLSGDLRLWVAVEKDNGKTAVQMVELEDDRRGPSLVLLGSAYDSSLRIAGRVGEAGSVLDSVEEVRALSWSLDGLSGGEELLFDRNGEFSLDVSTAGLSGERTLRVTAEDFNGHATTRSVLVSDDGVGPAVTILSPADGDTFNSTVAVSGRAVDSLEDASSTDEVKSLFWAIPGTVMGGSLEVDRFGDFSFRFSTIDLPDSFTLSITAEDFNNNPSVASIVLRDEGKGPVIAVETPKTDSFFGPTVEVVGRVVNSDEDPRSATEVGALFYSLTGSGGEVVDIEGAAGDIAFREDGGFTFSFSTLGLSEDLALTIRSEDLNGNASSESIRLRRSPGPYVAVTSPENRSFYRTDVSVVGRVSDSEDALEEVNTVESLAYLITGSDALPVEIEFDRKNGTFSFDFSAEKMTGNQSVQIIAGNSEGYFTHHLLNLRDGNAAPQIALDHPQDESSYGSMVTVRGRISLPYSGADMSREIASTSIEVSSAEIFELSSVIREDIVLDRDGLFHFVFPAQEMTGTQIITLTTEAWNGNRAERVVTLVEADNDIPSFRVAPADGSAELSWEPVPLSKDTALYYTDDGSEPSEGNGYRIDDAAPPLRLSDLTNGSLYCFVLRSRSELDMRDSWSAYERIIPLSPETLMPTVIGEYGEITVAWSRIAGAEAYRVWRAAGREGEYTPLREAATETVLTDTDVSYGKTYFYRIEPADHSSVPSEAVAGKTLPFPLEKLQVGETLTEIIGRAVYVKGEYAYVASGAGGVDIVDVSKPSRPVAVGECETDDARDVVVEGEYAYVADGGKGLKVLSISEPTDPQVIGMRNTSDARSIAVGRDSEGMLYAFVADGEQGVKVLEVTDPRLPNRVGTYDTSLAEDVVLGRGNEAQLYLYVADGVDGLRIFDVTDPRNPVGLGSCATEDARAVAVRGGYAYIADGESGLKIVDVTDPDNPECVGRHDSYMASDVAVGETEDGILYAFVADRKEGLRVFDVGDPAHPTQFGTFSLNDIAAATVGRTPDGRLFAFAADSSGLTSVHVMLQGKSFPVGSLHTDGMAYGIAAGVIRGGHHYAFLADHQGGIKVVDVTDPFAVDQESMVGSCDTEYARRLSVTDDRVYVADGKGGLKAIDGSAVWDGDPESQPEVIGSFPASDARSVFSVRAADRQMVFLAAGAAGLKVIDFTDPSDPEELAVYPLPDVRDVTAVDPLIFPYVLAADRESGLLVLSLNEPSPIGGLPDMDPRRVTAAVTGDGKILALVIDSTGVHLVDVTVPEIPAIRGTYATEYAEGIALHETASGRILALVAEGFRGFTLVDFTNPRSPRIVSTYREIYAVDVAAEESADGRLFALVTDTAGLQALEVLIPPWLQAVE